LSKQVNDKIEALAPQHQFSGWTTHFPAFARESLGITGRVGLAGRPISAQLTADRRRAATQKAGYFTLAELLILTDMDGRAFFDGEFGIRHRSTLPEGEVLHSVFAAALDCVIYNSPSCFCTEVITLMSQA